MTGISNAHHFRKTVAGTCMVLAPLFLLVGAVVLPDMKTDVSAQLAVVSDHVDGWYFANVMLLVAVVLMVPAVLGLMHMLREREVALGHIGGALALMGLIALAGIVAIDGFVFWQAAKTGGAAATLQSLHDATGYVIPFVIVSFGFNVGLAFLAYGLICAHAVTPYMALFLVVSAVCTAVGFTAALNWLAIVGSAFLLVGLGSIGRTVLMETDEEWEHTPEHVGGMSFGTR
jgi:hypothetical protein